MTGGEPAGTGNTISGGIFYAPVVTRFATYGIELAGGRLSRLVDDMHRWAAETGPRVLADRGVALGASPDDLVPFDKYANAALSLLNPSSAARAVESDTPF